MKTPRLHSFSTFQNVPKKKKKKKPQKGPGQATAQSGSAASTLHCANGHADNAGCQGPQASKSNVNASLGGSSASPAVRSLSAEFARTASSKNSATYSGWNMDLPRADTLGACTLGPLNAQSKKKDSQRHPQNGGIMNGDLPREQNGACSQTNAQHWFG